MQMQAVVLTNVPPSFQAEPSASNQMNEHSPPKAVHTATSPAVTEYLYTQQGLRAVTSYELDYLLLAQAPSNDEAST